MENLEEIKKYVGTTGDLAYNILLIDSDTEEAADIVGMMYQQILEEPEPEVQTFHRISSLYPDDTVYMKPEHKRSYSGYMYEKLEVIW